MNAPLASEPTEAGVQTLVPGVAPISLRARLEGRMAGPLVAMKSQKPMDVGLSAAAARDQLELFGPGGRVGNQLPPRGG